MSSKRNKSHATVTREADGYKLKINVRPESASRPTYIADWYDHNNKRIRRLHHIYKYAHLLGFLWADCRD
jgi:hypothetical protein